MTNADRIREMTDDELAELLEWRAMPDMGFVPDCDEHCEDYASGCALECPHDRREKNVREWLRKEYGT